MATLFVACVQMVDNEQAGVVTMLPLALFMANPRDRYPAQFRELRGHKTIDTNNKPIIYN